MRQKDLLIGFLIISVEIALFYYFWKNNILLTTFLAAISFLVLLKWADKKEKLLFFVGFLIGPVYDIILVPAGVWNYANPTFLNVPMWLPLAYGLGMVTVVKIWKNLTELYFKWA